MTEAESNCEFVNYVGQNISEDLERAILKMVDRGMSRKEIKDAMQRIILECAD